MIFEPGSKTAGGYLAIPEGGSRGPGVLVLHAWWGLNDFFVALCDRLAREGFVALAPDLYGGAVTASVAEAEALATGLDPAATRATLLAALDALLRHPAVRAGERAGTLGFSLGASWALTLAAARPENVAATVLFYGVGEADFAASRSAYLGHFAENDAWEPRESVRWLEGELLSAGKDTTFHVYPGVGHWFLEEDRPDAYDADAARLAWDRTLPFLRARLP